MGECFNCVGAASQRYTLRLEDSTVIEDVLICEECVSGFRAEDWIAVEETPVLLRGERDGESQ